MAKANFRDLPLLASLLPSWLAMAWLVSKAQWFWNHRPDLQFGWVVLLLCGYLFWEAWERRPQPRYRFSAGSIVAGLFGVGLLLFIQIYQAALGTTAATVQGLAVGVLAIVAANVSSIFGWAGVRHFAMAFGFLLVALPLPNVVYNPLVSQLQEKIVGVNLEILMLLGIPASREGNLIHLLNGTVGIDEACSGIRSLQSALMATLFIGYLALKRNGLRLALLAGGLSLAVAGNLVRSLFLSVVSSRGGTDAVKGYHDTAGWAILAFTVAGVGVLAWLLGQAEQRLAHDGLRVNG